MLILSPRDLRQNLNAKTILICIVVLYSHMTILFEFTCVMNVWDHTCWAFVTGSGPFSDSTSSFVHGPYNIRSTNTGQIQTFENNLWANFWQLILQQIPILLPWIGGRHCMVLRLCITVELFCSPVRNIFPHTSLHDQSCHKTMKKYEDFEWMVISLLSPQKFAIRTWFCNCPQYLCLFDIVVECKPNKRGQGMMLDLPNQLLCWVVSTSDQDFVSFQPILCHPHTQIKIILFHEQKRISIPNLETLSQPYFNRIFSNGLSP